MATVDDIPIEEVWTAALEVAPHVDSLASVGRATNEKLDVDWTDARWRGLFKYYPREREQVAKALGKQIRTEEKAVTIPGDVRGMVVSDIHAPYHDYNAIRLASIVARWWKPDVFVYNGDDVDFYGLSSFDKNPARLFSIQDEIDAWHTDAVAPLHNALPAKCRRIKTLGNHEDRLIRVLWRNPGLYGIRSLEWRNLLELDKYGIELATRSVYFGNALEVSHGERVSKWAGYSARMESEKRRYRISTITGHVHRQGRWATNVLSRSIVAQEAGCLCGLEPEYMAAPDWTQGFVLFEVRNGHVRIDAVEIYPDYTCTVGGKWFGLD